MKHRFSKLNMKKGMKVNFKEIKCIAFSLSILVIVFTFKMNVRLDFAEQSGSSPDSGLGTSVLMTTYDWLVSKGTNYGSSQPSDWTYDWGTYWNRIMYSAYWEPDGTATEEDVSIDKTFHSGSSTRTIRSGTTWGFPSDYEEFSLQDYSDGHESDYTDEESEWIKTNSTPGSEVWYDTRTELYWARSEPAVKSNSFGDGSGPACSFFATVPRGDYGTSGTDPDCGNAINACAILSLASVEGESANTDWYLPTQKESFQAYVDGVSNQTESELYVGVFWTTTQMNSSEAYYVSFLTGGTSYSAKSGSNIVHCVRRD